MIAAWLSGKRYPASLKYFVLLTFSVSVLLGQRSVHYQLRFPNAVHHEAEIRATFTGITTPDLEVRMSRSSPGRYSLHEFAKNIYHVRASDRDGRDLPLLHPDPSSWIVPGRHDAVTVSYTLYGDHADGTYAGIDNTHSHLNAPATFLWARGFENAPAFVAVDIPPGSGWKVATELAPEPDGTWSAPTLEMLMDGPLEISAFDLREWKIGDATFRLVLHHLGTPQEASDFAAMCQTVVREEEGVFGALPKYDHGTYTFLIDFLPWVYGDGMEHRDSTVITGKADLKTAASRQIGTVSHEFFHSWNVRRIRPRSLEPFDFTRADMSGELWFAEGVTSYYGPLSLTRAGLMTLDDLAKSMGRAVNEVLTAPGRNVHSAVEMSELAPFVDAAKSVDGTNFVNTAISYYTYGQALGLGVDLAIRQHFPGKTLDDWMRTMWREHPDIEQPYTLADLEKTLGETVGDSHFASEVFSRHIAGREPMPYADLLARAGLVLRKAHEGKVWLGADKLEYKADAVEIGSNTLVGSPLYNAGLDNGDLILKWDGKSLNNSSQLTEWLAKQKPGDHVILDISSRAQKKSVTLVFLEDPSLELVTFERASRPVTPDITAFRASWLKSKALR